ncbi:MAG: TetR/AcrR family transcriptional regulator [Bacteroidetes bacterium]|nr:TetR/AcrR family transcriptional regulator [Bacteroidota bacterium]
MLDKRDQILEAAEELFAQKGFEGTSVRDLAKKAKVNVAMISYYFGSKEKLFESLVEYRAAFLREKLQLINREEVLDPISKIEMLIDFYVDRITSQSRFSRILHRELSLQQRSEMHNAIADIILRNAHEMRKIIQEGIRKKVFRKMDAEMLIATLVGTTMQATNSKEMVCKLIGSDPQKFSFNDTRYKNRLKNYLKDLMRTTLLYSKKQSA